jgi:DNA-binding PadR family transcriptional regulator
MDYYQINKKGRYEIQDWINRNKDKNMKVFDLWANGIASEINRDSYLEEQLENNQEFEYETRLKDARGYPLNIRLDLNCFNKTEVSYE